MAQGVCAFRRKEGCWLTLPLLGRITVPCLRQFATRHRPGARQELLLAQMPFTHGSKPRETPQVFTQPVPVLEVVGLGCEWHKARLKCLAGAGESLLMGAGGL